MEKLTPYPSPYLPEFDRPNFKKQVLAWPVHGAPWTYLNCPAKNAYDGRPWQPKLYVCVGPKDYWRCVRELLGIFLPTPTRWKFFAAAAAPWPAGYGRPDKIVFYPRSAREMSSLAGRLKSVIKGASVHEISHAAPASRMGLEKAPASGLWVGCDPMFLNDGSWRLYRTYAVAFAEKNRGYLENLRGGYRGWARRMNLSLEHEGPASLNPPAADVPYVRRWWRLITGG